MTQCELNSREDTRVAKSNWIADGWAVIGTTGVQLNMRNNEWPIDTASDLYIYNRVQQSMKY